MTQDDLRHYFCAHPSVHMQIAAPGDDSPELAWGDTFFTRIDESGVPRKMPFATLVTKDYGTFDDQSRLDRGGLFRLNLDVGRAQFEALFGFAPSALEAHREGLDFAAIDRLFPHPVYGSAGWVSIINPGPASREQLLPLLAHTLERAMR